MSLEKMRKFCSRSCATKYNISSRQDCGNPWSEEELNLLNKWIGNKPINLIKKDWNKIAEKKGWEKRSPEGIKAKATRLTAKSRGSVKCYGDNWDSRKLARLLGVQQDKVRSWRRRGIIAYTKLSKNQTAISRKQLKEFAIAHPEELGGIEPKRLRRVLKDGKLVKNITQVAHNAPKVGRKITVVRLDTGDVYPSARSAACAIAPEMGCIAKSAKSNILRVAKRDTPMKNGMDFYQLDYPVFWCPIDLRDEFNEFAGKVVYELYLNICNLSGYSKQSCLVVAARLAVKITLTAFNIKARWLENPDSSKPYQNKSREAIAQFYCDIWLKKLTYIYDRESQFVLNKIRYIIKNRMIGSFYKIAKGNKLLAEDYLESFINYYFEKEIAKFYKDSYIPLNYSPSDKLQRADLWTQIYHSLNIRFWLGKEENGTRKLVPWLYMAFIHFCRDYKLNEENNVLTVSFNQNWAEHTPNQEDAGTRVSSDTRDVREELSSSTNEGITIDSLLAAAKQIYDRTTFDSLSMLVALKLEDASDREIAECMNIKIVEIPKMLTMLAQAQQR